MTQALPRTHTPASADTKPWLDSLAAITVNQACSALNVSHDTLYRWEKQGKLRFWRVGAVVRIPLAELERLTKTEPPKPRGLDSRDAWAADHRDDDDQ